MEYNLPRKLVSRIFEKPRDAQHGRPTSSASEIRSMPRLSLGEVHFVNEL